MTAPVDARPTLTPRQVQVVAGLARGGTEASIGRALGVARATVHRHVENAARAAGVSGHRHAGLVDFGYRTGVLAGLTPEPRARIVLSPRMADVLDGLARGVGLPEIAVELGLSEGTVRTHAKRLYAALGVGCRAHAVAIGWQCGLLADRDAARPAATRVGEAGIRELWGRWLAGDRVGGGARACLRPMPMAPASGSYRRVNSLSP